jgi:ADP-heptose:LPS heptosyltransferase
MLNDYKLLVRKILPEEAEAPPRGILVLQLGKIGDMVLTTPLFDGLKGIYPESPLTVIATEGTAIIPAYHPAVDSVIPIRRGFLKIPVLARDLFPRRFEIYIDPKDHKSTTSRLIAELIHAERAILHSGNIPRRVTAEPLPPADPPGHYVDRMLAPLKIVAPGAHFSRRPTLGIPSEVFRDVDDRINPGESGTVTINISAGDPSRYWVPGKWEELIAEISKRYSVAVISAPADRPLADEICTMRRSARPIATRTILEAAAVVAHSVAVITPDTSIVHLASVFDKPTVGLYPPIDWNARYFAPLATRHRVVMAKEEAAIAEITVEQVLEAFNAVMQREPVGD